MSVSLTRFLAGINAIYAERPTYREGGLARDGTCDCVGMVIAAMLRSGHASYPLKSSNYFARCQIDDMQSDISASDVYIGMVVFKRRMPGDARYALPDRDNVGGRYYNGDLSDYYHIGVVTGVDPLAITHCTSGDGVNGTTKDYKLGSWSCGGRLNGVDYEDYTSEEGNLLEVLYKATVIAASGKTVRVRREPGGDVLGTLGVGAVVDVYAEVTGYCRIGYNGGTAYMQSAFLAREAEQETGLAERITALEVRVAALEYKQ